MVVKAVISMIPIAGSPAAELFAFIIAPPIEKRRDEWIQAIADGLYALQDKVNNFKLDDLAQNEAFVSTLLQASRSAIAHHQEEQRQALCNAVLNAALPEAPHDTRQKLFIGWLDELTVWHIKILTLFTEPGVPDIDLDDERWRMDIALDKLGAFIEQNHAQLRGQFDLYVQLVSDLHSKGLIANKHPGRSIMTLHTRNPTLTELAKEFLRFIRSPLDAYT